MKLKKIGTSGKMKLIRISRKMELKLCIIVEDIAASQSELSQWDIGYL